MTGLFLVGQAYSSPGSFWEWIGFMDPGMRFAVVFFALISAVFVIAIVAGVIYKVHKNRLEDALKRELLDRGMSAADIAMVVRAKPGTEQADVRTS
jgi:mannitol-specific phosphotransferase system IIBC component